MDNVLLLFIDLSQYQKLSDKNINNEVKVQSWSVEHHNCDVHKLVKVIQTCFSMTKATAKRYQDALENSPEQYEHFFVELEQKIVAVATIFLDKPSASKKNKSRVAGFYNLSVLPEFRSKGIGKALKDIRLKWAKKNGFEFATLQATPMGAGIDKKIGFEVLSILSIIHLDGKLPV